MFSKSRPVLITLACLALLGARLHAADAAKRSFAGRTLEEALQDLSGEGLKLVYSSALVKPGMRIAAEPEGKTPRELLESMLALHGLKAKAGPDGAVLVVKRASSAAASPVSVVSFVKVLSDKVPDVSSLEAWKKSCLKDGMSDYEKALAVWRTVVGFQHQETPPLEYLNEGDTVKDPIKIFNVYGYSMCDAAASNIECLARAAGLPARGRIINNHSVSEIFFDGEWRLLDASLINYFPKADGRPAGVDEIIGGVKDWLDKNPSYRGNNELLGKFMRGEGWKKGPEILSRTTAYDVNGWFPAATHGWYSTMQEYDCDPGQIYEYGYTEGYQVNIQLRQGERLTRNWFNKGLHVNTKGGGGTPYCINLKNGQENMRYAPVFGDIAPGRIGNGLHEYDVPLANGAFRASALSVENLAAESEDHASPAVHTLDEDKNGVLVLRMPSSYVYLNGTATFKAVVAKGGQIAVALSGNNGLDWNEIAKYEASGDQSLDLTESVNRRYDYRIRFEFKGKGTGLDSLRFAHEIQHSQRALPALGEGENTLTFSAGPAESTVTVQGSLDPANKGKQLVFADFKPVVNGMDATGQLWIGATGKGDVTFPVETPYEMTRLRFGAHYRARDARDGIDYQASFDGGKTWKTLDRAAGPTPGDCKYISFGGLPAGATKALVRFTGTSRNATGILQFRIDADYKEIRGGFAPIKVSYVWDENGVEKRQAFIAKQENESWTIHCGAKPLMKSIVLERAE
ncbi:MAG: hypothetical protein HY291_20390 [Planctomycetes bacterium]|nr:hypothetical protein [Planctomycetota bacterium]